MLASIDTVEETNGEVKSLSHVETSPPEAIRELLRQVVEAAQQQGNVEVGEGGVLLDVEIEGVGCTLFRIAASTTQTMLLSPREQEIARMVAAGYPNK